MRYLLSIIVFVLARSEIWLSHFSAGPSSTAIHQVNSTLLIVGTKDGNLLSYTPKGQFISEQQEPHHSAITSINSFPTEDSSLIFSSDKQGVLSVWSQNGELQQKINKSSEILEIVISNKNSQAFLAVNMGNFVDIHELPSFKLIKTVRKEKYIFRKILFVEQKLYLLAENQQTNSIWAYDIVDYEFEQIMRRQPQIKDFSISSSNGSHFLFMINKYGRLEIYHLGSDYSILDSLHKSESQLMQSSYSSLTYFQNSEQLPLFVTVKASQQLQFFNGFDITLFLQLNSQLKVVRSTLNKSLILLSANGQVTTITEAEDEEIIDTWIILLILLLLAAGLYLCCGDCWPGVMEKWRLQKERKEIELELYRQRTDLENF